MDFEKSTVGELIAEWLQVIMLCAHQSRENAKRMSNGLQTRIRPKQNKPKILDHKTHIRQKEIQAALVKKLPHLKELICSEPAIADHDWPASDYIELYAEHFTIVIQKLCEMTTNAK